MGIFSVNEGFITLHRKMLDWEWYTETNTFAVFLHCLFKANWKDVKYRGTLVKRGQFLTSRDKLASEINLSVQNVRTALNNLKSTNELTIETSRQGTVITVNNYDKYQLPTNQVTNDQPPKQPTANQQLTSSNKDNKDIYYGEEPKEPKKPNRKTKAQEESLPIDPNLLLPEHWSNLAMKYWEERNCFFLCPKTEFFKFKNHHLAKGTTSCRWQANWQTWYANAIKFNRDEKPQPARREL